MFKLYDDVLVKSLKDSSSSYYIMDYVYDLSIVTPETQLLANSNILSHTITSHAKNFYFNRLLHIWNALPPIDLPLSTSTTKTSNFCATTFD